MPLACQCELAGVARSTVYAPRRVAEADPEGLALLDLIDAEYTRHPFYGSRKMVIYLGRMGHRVNRKRVQRLMRVLGLAGMAPGPDTSRPHPQHKVYPYLLRGMEIDRPNQVWGTDITYVRLARGFVYLVAVIDWYSRKVLAWRVSNTLDSGFCVDCLGQALQAYGNPEIFNSDQGSQFTSEAFTGVLKGQGIDISMDGRGRALDNILLKPPFAVPEGFAIWHLALGCDGLAGLFSEQTPVPLLRLDDKPAIRTRAQESPLVAAAKTAEAVEPAPVDQSNGASAPFTPPLPPAVSAPTVPPVAVPAASSVAVEAKSPAPPAIESSPPSNAVIVPVPVLPTVPERLLIGTRGNGEPVYWHYGHSQLNNRHLLIFGASGSGKTYGIQCLLAEMAKQRLHSLIIDYTDGFLPHQTEALFREIAKPQDQFLKINRLPLNPFRRQWQLIDPSQPKFQETANDVATRVANIFSSIFEIGEQQFPTLIRAIRAGIEQNPAFCLDNLLPSLKSDDSTYGETLARKLEPLIMAQPFTEGEHSAWEQMLSDPQCWVQVLQLKGLAREIQKMVTEFTLWDLYDYASNTGSQSRPIPIVLDEIQNLDHRSDSPIDKMLREGRKFGLSLLLATQTTSQFNQEQRDRLFQAGHKLFFKPADTEIGRFADLLSQKGNLSKSDWGQKLANLQKGQCWSLGSVLTSSEALKEEALLVSVTPLEQRYIMDNV